MRLQIDVDEKTADHLREIAEFMQSTPEEAAKVVLQACSDSAKELIEKIYKAGVLDE